MRESNEERRFQPWIEEKFVRLDGQPIDVEVATLTAVFEDQPLTQVMVHNITESKLALSRIQELNHALEERATALEIANQDLDSFSYSVSHDLRTPLATIDGFARMLGEDHSSELSAEAKRYLSFVRGGAHQMEELIESLLNLARLSRHALQRPPVQMTALVMEAMEPCNKSRRD